MKLSFNRYHAIYILSMIIYGTAPLLTHYIAMPAAMIVFIRACLGMIFLLIYKLAIKRDRFNLIQIKKNIIPLIVCGVFIGLNWVTLFSGYILVNVATATIFNYFAPFLIFIVGAILFKNHVSIKKIICLIVAFIGILFVLGVFDGAIATFDGFSLFVLITIPFTYLILVIANKFMKDIPITDRIIFTMFFAAITILPFMLATTDFSLITFGYIDIILYLVLGLVHTAGAYLLYFGSMAKLDTQDIAIFSYIEPVVAILLSIIILKEKLTIFVIIGAVLVLVSAIVSDVDFNKLFKRNINNQVDEQ